MPSTCPYLFQFDHHLSKPCVRKVSATTSNAASLRTALPGPGAAGISAQGEIDRTNLLIAEAKKQGIKIIGLHIGGKSRRGEMSGS